jgi:hypothetical protein
VFQETREEKFLQDIRRQTMNWGEEGFLEMDVLQRPPSLRGEITERIET